MRTTLVITYLITLCGLSNVFSQTLQNGATPSAEDATKTTPTSKDEKIPLYNLFYLSKYLSQNLNTAEQKEMAYAALVNLVGKDKIQNLPNDNYYPTVLEFKKKYVAYRSTIVLKEVQSLRNEGRINEILESNKITTPKTLTKILSSMEANDSIIVDNLKRYTTDSDNIKVKVATKEKYYLLQDAFKVDSTLNDEQKKLLTEAVASISNEDQIKKIKCYQKEKNLNFFDQNFRQKERYDDLSAFVDSAISSLNTDIQKETAILTKTDSLITSLTEQNELLLNDLALELANILPSSIQSAGLKNLQSTASQQRVATNAIIQVNATTQAAQQGISYTGLSLPSESQMIEAMAMFLAKRAKHEAAIWFMDQLRQRVNNPLIYDVFPETITLLEGLEDYRTANFGTSWRYAIAKDFVEMPRNIAHSEWTKQYLGKDQAADLSTAIDFGYDLERLMKERYNYRDIIRHFYLNPSYQMSTNASSLKANIQHSFSLLYMATNELFAISPVDGNETYRLLTYEELLTLDKDQWTIFMELIRLKYGDRLADIPAAKTVGIDQEKTTRWLGNLLIALGQFDKINQEQQALRQNNKLDPNDQSFYSIWKVINQVITSLDASPYLQGAKNLQFTRYAEHVKNVTGIIEDIQSRNFVAATHKSLSLIEHFYANDMQVHQQSTIAAGFRNGKLVLRTIDNAPLLISDIDVGKGAEGIELTPQGENIKLSYLSSSAGKKNFFELVLSKADYDNTVKTIHLAQRMREKEQIEFIKEALALSESPSLRNVGRAIHKNIPEHLQALKVLTLYAQANKLNSEKDISRLFSMYQRDNFEISPLKTIAGTAAYKPQLAIKNDSLEISVNDKRIFKAKVNAFKIDKLNITQTSDGAKYDITYYYAGKNTKTVKGETTESKAVNNAPVMKKYSISADQLSKIARFTSLAKTMKPRAAEQFIEEKLKDQLDDLKEHTNERITGDVYSLRMLNLLGLYGNLINLTDVREFEKIKNTFSSLDLKLTNVEADLIPAVGSKFSNTYQKRYGEQLVKLTGFFGDVLSSSTSAELANVIESHALPPTSYKLKRKMRSSLDLNAYVGAFGGHVWTASNATVKKGITGGITAPIGVTYKPAGGNFFKMVNFHVQVLDLGNIVNHYLMTPNTAYPNEVHFSEVLSPGFNALFNIPGAPLVAYAGVKLLPLKAFSETVGSTTTMRNNRVFDATILSIGLKLDIPLLNLYTKE